MAHHLAPFDSRRDRYLEGCLIQSLVLGQGALTRSG